MNLLSKLCSTGIQRLHPSGGPGHPFGLELTAEDKADLIAFLKTLRPLQDLRATVDRMNAMFWALRFTRSIHDPEELQRTMDFIIEHQARFAVAIEQEREERLEQSNRDQQCIAQVEATIVLIVANLGRLTELAEVQPGNWTSMISISIGC